MCVICGKPGGSGPPHHHFWPKKRFKKAGLPLKQKTLVHEVHTACHDEYHIFWYNNCQRVRNCLGCRYGRVCCYKNYVGRINSDFFRSIVARYRTPRKRKRW